MLMPDKAVKNLDKYIKQLQMMILFSKEKASHTNLALCEKNNYP